MIAQPKPCKDCEGMYIEENTAVTNALFYIWDSQAIQGEKMSHLLVLHYFTMLVIY
jgi:hypothetical protein